MFYFRDKCSTVFSNSQALLLKVKNSGLLTSGLSDFFHKSQAIKLSPTNFR